MIYTLLYFALLAHNICYWKLQEIDIPYTQIVCPQLLITKTTGVLQIYLSCIMCQLKQILN